jgi:hypothetical protein
MSSLPLLLCANLAKEDGICRPEGLPGSKVTQATWPKGVET